MKRTAETIAAERRASKAEARVRELELELEDRNAAWEMHPEDRQAQLDGTAYGRSNGEAFCKTVQPQLTRLVSEYSDAKAQALLDELRERFWLREWEQKR